MPEREVDDKPGSAMRWIPFVAVSHFTTLSNLGEFVLGSLSEAYYSF